MPAQRLHANDILGSWQRPLDFSRSKVLALEIRSWFSSQPAWLCRLLVRNRAQVLSKLVGVEAGALRLPPATSAQPVGRLTAVWAGAHVLLSSLSP